MNTYKIKPVPKPRMTQRDKWLNPPRPGVANYRAFKDEVKYQGVILPEHGACVTFLMPMPKSWSKKKKEKMCARFHQQKPDLDNLLKALSDAVYTDDSSICQITVEKIWAYEGAISIS